jgi:hypothetical protein
VRGWEIALLNKDGTSICERRQIIGLKFERGRKIRKRGIELTHIGIG